MAHRTNTGASTEDRTAITELEAKLENLKHLTVGLLQIEWERVFGERARSRNKDFLRKRVGFRLQELAEGGLSDRAKARSKELAKQAPLRRRAAPTKATVASVPAAPSSAPAKARDPRLPPAGALLRRKHKERVHVVRVLDVGFLYDGRTYRSLSAIAKQICGCECNGFAFFALSGAAS